MDGILTKQLKGIIADCGVTQYAIAGMLNLELRQTKPLAKKSKGR
jgi:hypothetical protein